MTIFALSVFPYITSFNYNTTTYSCFPQLEALKKEVKLVEKKLINIPDI